MEISTTQKLIIKDYKEKVRALVENAAQMTNLAEELQDDFNSTDDDYQFMYFLKNEDKDFTHRRIDEAMEQLREAIQLWKEATEKMHNII